MSQQVEGSIWSATVDNNRFLVAVWPIEGKSHTGQLRVSVIENDEELLSDQVRLDYGAIFGADVANVNEWQARAIEAIDAYLRARGEEIPEEPTTEQGEG